MVKNNTKVFFLKKKTKRRKTKGMAQKVFCGEKQKDEQERGKEKRKKKVK